MVTIVNESSIVKVLSKESEYRRAASECGISPTILKSYVKKLNWVKNLPLAYAQKRRTDTICELYGRTFFWLNYYRLKLAGCAGMNDEELEEELICMFCGDE